MAASPLPFDSIENEFLRVEYLTTTGPRIIGLYANGVKDNLLAETPDVHWPTPHGEYYLRGGHRLWVAPEDPLHTCPEDDLRVIAEKDQVSLRSNVDASGLEKEISFHLEQNCVVLTHRVSWHGEKPIGLAPWAITQLRLGGVAVLPQSASSGLQPNRNLVLWPYSQVGDERLELYDDLILIHGKSAELALKLGNYNPLGWIAYLLPKALFIKRFSVYPIQRYPDLGCNVEVYVKDSCLELETLGCLTNLASGESMFYDERWELVVGTYNPTLENARRISKQLS